MTDEAFMGRWFAEATKPQLASHVTDYYCFGALANLRAMGACGRSASRKLSDDEFDYNQFSNENGDGEII